MWNQIKREFRRDRYLLLFVGSVFVFLEGGSILASFRNDVPEMEQMVISCPILACIFIIIFAVMAVIRSAGKPEKNDAVIPQHHLRILLFLIYSLTTGFICFLCVGHGVALLHPYPDVVREIKGILGIFVFFYTRLDIPLSLESSICIFLLFFFSVLMIVETYAFMIAVMKYNNIRKRTRIIVYVSLFIIGCLAVRIIWSLQMALTAKDFLTLISALALYITNCILIKRTADKTKCDKSH